eukprot:GABW01002841.1.p2 GENE.GABW01002841.1~~GABW01002841.1.p2  ORF type:complete len:65 (-),score=4.52 GABW01002841.1:3-197(-)
MSEAQNKGDKGVTKMPVHIPSLLSIGLLKISPEAISKLPPQLKSMRMALLKLKEYFHESGRHST